MATTEHEQTPSGSAVRTALLARTLAGVLIIGLVASLIVNRLGSSSDDHYTPPTTPGDRTAIKVGETAPDFTLSNAKGEAVSLASFRGKPTIILFFRTFG